MQMAELSETESNRQVIREHYEKLARGDWRGAAETFATDARNFGREGGREMILRILEDVYTTLPDWRFEAVDIVAAADVVVRSSVSGTHRGVGKLRVNGGMLVGVPPTGKSFTVPHMHWYVMRDGVIIDHFATRDDLGMMQQLGLIAGVGG